MKKISFLFAFLLILATSYSQGRILSGKIFGYSSDASLTDAHISIYQSDNGQIICQGISGKDGFFSIDGLPPEIVLLKISYLGYKVFSQEIDLTSADLKEHDIVLYPSPVEAGEVIVSASRQDKMFRDVSLPLGLVSRNRVDQLPGMTPANLLQDVPGINLSRDGIWSTSMNIRGLTEQRIVALVDGNRIETATDIAAGLAMVDVNDIERIEVIKGAASSLYGTGALGGVVNMITREGHYNNSFTAGGSLNGSYQTVNKLLSENVSLDLADEKWYLRLSGTLRDAENTMTPEGELLNSRFTDNNISFKAGVRLLKNHEFTLNYQRFHAQDVGIPGGTAFPPTATAIYPEELRNMFSAAYTITRNKGALSRLKFKYFNQFILRDVELKPGKLVTVTPSGYHTTNGFQMQTDWNSDRKHQFIAGVDIWQRHLSTEREKRVETPVTDSAGNEIARNVTIRGEVPIPDAWFTSGGVFLQEQVSLMNNRLNLTLGGRFDIINTRNDQALDPEYIIQNGTVNDNPPKQRISFKSNNVNNYSWSLDASALYHLFSRTDLTLNVSKAYRAPGIEERFKYIDLGSTVRIGDPNLKPEQGYFIDLGTRVWKDRFQISGNVFTNFMSGLIVEVPGTFIYNYSAEPDNYDTINALINSNVDKAILSGFDISAGYNIFDGITLKGLAGFVNGRNTGNDSNLPQIPPLNGRFTLKYYMEGILSTELSANLFADQDKVAEGEKVTKGFASYDFGIYSVPVKFFNIRAEAIGGIQNITDRAYRNHLATNRGIIKYEPGRNFYIKIRLDF